MKKPAAKKTAPRTTPKKPATPKKGAGFAVPKKLRPRELRFVEEYLIDLNATQAAIRAGYSPKTASVIGYENINKPHIRVEIERQQQQRSERTQITADAALKEVWAIATADPRDLVQVKVACCRHCHGYGFGYQRTVAEMNADREKWALSGGRMDEFDERGGIGFNPLLPPRDDCPACGGDGQARVVLADTSKLPDAARALYAGAKQGKHGIEIVMHSKMDAMEKVFKHLGLYERDNQQKTDPLSSLLTRIATTNNNGFKPVADDPERQVKPNTILPKAEPDADDED